MKKQKKLKDIPEFNNEDEERDFWATHSALDFPDRFKKVVLYFPNLRFTKSLKITKDKNGKETIIQTYSDKKPWVPEGVTL